MKLSLRYLFACLRGFNKIKPEYFSFAELFTQPLKESNSGVRGFSKSVITMARIFIYFAFIAQLCTTLSAKLLVTAFCTLSLISKGTAIFSNKC